MKLFYKNYYKFFNEEYPGKYFFGLIRFLAIFLIFLATESALAQNPQKHTSRYYVELAQQHELANAWDAVKKVIDEGLALYPSDPDLRYLNGRYYYYAERNLPQARYNLVKAIQESDQNWSARRVLIDVEEDSKHYSSAICYINELLEEQPYDKDLWKRKIALFDRMGNKLEADAALTRLARIYPNDTVLRNAVVMRNRENWDKRLNHTTINERIATLEQYLEIDDRNLDYYEELTDLYIKLGDYTKALGMTRRGLAKYPGNAGLIRRATGIMSELGLYTRALSFMNENHVRGTLYENIMREAANDARMRDPYEISGRLYATTGDREALQYLLNTSLTRGYYDDALGYLNEFYKKEGRTTELVMKEYDLQKRMGNEKASRRLLQELYVKNPQDNDLKEEYISMMMGLANIEIEQQEWESALEKLQEVTKLMTEYDEVWGAAVSRQIQILGKLNRLEDAKRLYASASVDNRAMQPRFASAYEELVAAKIKTLIEDERYIEALDTAEDLLSLIFDNELGLRTAINMSQTLKRQDQFFKYAQRGYEKYPEQTYFIIKHALALEQQGKYEEALKILTPQKEGDLYPNPQLVNPYTGVSIDWTIKLLKDKNPKKAMALIDSALVFDFENSELLYLKGLAYEQMKDYGKAYDLLSKNYNPSNAEYEEWTQHMRDLKFKSFKNRIDATYITAYYDNRTEELSTVAHLYSIASLEYSHLFKKGTLNVGFNYKGLDGYRTELNTQQGGVGLEFFAGWDMPISKRWNMAISGSYSTRFFNKIGANISFYVDAGKGWTPGIKLGYRLTPPMDLYVKDGDTWRADYNKYHMLILTPYAEKSWERLKLTAGVDVISMNFSNFYYNANVKGKIFVTHDNISSVAVMGGFGSFPSLTFFDQTVMNGITHTNAMVGVEGIWLITKNLFIGLAGMWDTYYNPAFIEGYAVSSYRNVFSVNASLHVAF